MRERNIGPKSTDVWKSQTSEKKHIVMNYNLHAGSMKQSRHNSFEVWTESLFNYNLGKNIHPLGFSYFDKTSESAHYSAVSDGSLESLLKRMMFWNRSKCSSAIGGSQSAPIQILTYKPQRLPFLKSHLFSFLRGIILKLQARQARISDFSDFPEFSR